MSWFKWVLVVTYVVLTTFVVHGMFNDKGEPCHPAYCTF